MLPARDLVLTPTRRHTHPIPSHEHRVSPYLAQDRREQLPGPETRPHTSINTPVPWHPQCCLLHAWVNIVKPWRKLANIWSSVLVHSNGWPEEPRPGFPYTRDPHPSKTLGGKKTHLAMSPEKKSRLLACPYPPSALRILPSPLVVAQSSGARDRRRLLVPCPRARWLTRYPRFQEFSRRLRSYSGRSLPSRSGAFSAHTSAAGTEGEETWNFASLPSFLRP